MVIMRVVQSKGNGIRATSIVTAASFEKQQPFGSLTLRASRKYLVVPINDLKVKTHFFPLCIIISATISILTENDEKRAW